MKKTAKTLTAASLVLAAFALASCDSKLCYCYEYTSQSVREQEAYTNTDTPCASLSRGESRICVERAERMDPGDLAFK